MELEQTQEREKEMVTEKEQKSFLETTLGKTINTGLDIGLRMLLPDLIEEQVIDIKDTIIENGFGEGVKKAISSAIDLGKSVVGIFTGNFESVSQAQTAVKDGGIIDGISNVLDFALDKVKGIGIIPNVIVETVKQGKDVLLDNMANKIEEEFNQQIEGIEELQRYNQNWKENYQNQNFAGMQEAYSHIEEALEKVLPLESTLKETREIENIHKIIQNNNGSFQLSEEQLKLASIFT